jgi:heavy metal efflux system protein
VLNAIISWSIRNRALVLLASLALAVIGLHALTRLPIDAFPDTTPVQVQVNTAAPALAPLEVERQVTAPVERAISGLPQLLEVRSVSKFGLSQVTVIFQEGADIYRARQTVMERLQTVDLPEGLARPQLGPVATGLGEVLHYLVTGPGVSLADLRTVQDWVVKPQLQSVSGVAEINTWGGDERQLHVVVDPSVLASQGLTLEQLVSALERNNANVGGGTLDRSGQSSLVQGVAAVTRPEQIEDIVVAARTGVPILVRDVARVAEGREIRRGAVTADGRGEVVLGLGFMLTGENSGDVTHRLKARLLEVAKSLPAGVTVETVYDRTELVEHVLRTVRENLLLGALLVVAVLFAFLGNWRAGLIVASAIPLSMLFAFDLMVRAGVAGTLMSLGALDFGLIVDSSVIMVENSVRRLGGDESDRSQAEIVQEAALEVRRPTLFGELIIMVVYLPLLALEGVEGKLFRPMALTVIFALLGSLLLSLTLMPALCATFLRRHPVAEPRFMRALRSRYRAMLRAALARPRLVLGTALALVLGAGLSATRLGSEFVPRLGEGSIVINTVRLAGVSMEESVRYGTKIERMILDEFPNEVARVWTRTGTAEVATDPMGTEVSDVFLTLRPRAEWKRARSQEDLVREIEKELSVLPAMRMVFTQPIEMRMNEMVAGVRSDLAIKIFGDDFDVLRMKSREIEAIVRAIPGAADVLTEQITGQPVLQIEVDRERIARHGIAAGEVLDAVQALGRREVGVLQDGERRFPIAVTLDERLRADPEAVASIVVTSAGGDRVPLGQLARIQTIEGPSTINREWAKRRIVVQANVRGRDVGGFVSETRRVLERVQLPPGYYVRYGGQFEQLERARGRLLVVVPLALLLILVLLYFSYRRVSDVIRVFLAVPFAVVGGVAALWVRGLPFSISAAVGFIALSGVAVLNALVLVTTIRQLLAAGIPLREAVAEAAERRLRPVLMTALVASAGFIPMALNTGIGAEVQRPLATVVIGGVLSSTLLTLFVLPVLYGGSGEWYPPRHGKRD